MRSLSPICKFSLTHSTGMNVKNAFYTMVRFIAYTIWFMNAKEKPHEITSMLADRKFLQILAEKGIFLVSMHRRSIFIQAIPWSSKQ